MFCALLGQDIRRAFTGPLVLWFVNRFSKFLRRFLRLLECKRMIRSNSVGAVLEQGNMQKGSFQRMV